RRVRIGALAVLVADAAEDLAAALDRTPVSDLDPLAAPVNRLGATGVVRAEDLRRRRTRGARGPSALRDECCGQHKRRAAGNHDCACHLSPPVELRRMARLPEDDLTVAQSRL